MSLDPTTPESDLRRLRPAALDESLLERLDACAAGTWKKLEPAEIAFEKKLNGFMPVQLSAALTASLEATLAGVAFPKEEKIVPFPKPEVTTPRRQRGWWGAAAAVGLIGAFSALLVPMGPDKTAGVTSAPVVRPANVSSSGDRLVPAGFNRGLREASDEGIVWKENDQPHRMLKVVYDERASFKDSQGRTVELEQPRVEYILVPEKTD